MLLKISGILRVLVTYIYVPVCVLLLELFLRVLTDNSALSGFPFSLLFLVSFGFMINCAAALIGKPVVVRVLLGASLFLLGLIYSLEYFMYQSYKVFMPLGAIIAGAKNLIVDFLDVFLSTIITGIPIILAFFLPFIIYLVLTIKRLSPYSGLTKEFRVKCAAVSAALSVLAFCGQLLSLNYNASSNVAVRSEYHFDTSSRRLGLLPGVFLDFWYSVFDNPLKDAAFVSVNMPQSVILPDDPSGPARSLSPLPNGAVVDNPEPTPTPVVYGYNSLDIDFDTLIENESNEKIRATHEYVSSLPASKQNEYTGLFEGKNLIILTAEAFTKQVIDPVMTPTLYRLAHNGFYFSDFYQPLWGAGTAGGEFSILTGLPPLHSSGSTLVATSQNISYTMGNRLMNLGYNSVAFHNGSYEFYDRHLTHAALGYEDFIAFGNGLRELMDGGYSGSDLDMMKATLPTYIDKQPFSVYYMTYSGHAGYSLGNSIAKKNWDAFPQQYSEMLDPIRAYMACNLELEYALEYLVSELEKAGIADDTVIVLASDHYPYGLVRSETWESEEDFLSILYGVDRTTFLDRDGNALLLWSGCLENEHKDLAVEISSPAYTLDILPTLLNLFGLEFDSRMFIGRDVFSDAPALVLWSIDRSWKTDAGYFHRNTFVPVDEKVIIPEDYADNVRAIVNNKINYAGSVLSFNYFNKIYNEDGTIREGVLRTDGIQEKEG